MKDDNAPESIYLYVNEKGKFSISSFTWTEEDFHTPGIKYTRANTEQETKTND